MEDYERIFVRRVAGVWLFTDQRLEGAEEIEVDGKRVVCFPCLDGSKLTVCRDPGLMLFPLGCSMHGAVIDIRSNVGLPAARLAHEQQLPSVIVAPFLRGESTQAELCLEESIAHFSSSLPKRIPVIRGELGDQLPAAYNEVCKQLWRVWLKQDSRLGETARLWRRHPPRHPKRSRRELLMKA